MKCIHLFEFEDLATLANNIDFVETTVDAKQVPKHLKGIITHIVVLKRLAVF